MKKIISIAIVTLLSLSLFTACDGNIPEEDLTLSSVLYDYTFTLDGDSITLPLTLKEFQEMGWELPSNSTLPEIIEGHTRLLVPRFVKNGKEISIDLINLNENDVPMNQAIIFQITSSLDYDNPAVIELPKGIILGKSSKNDVIKVFGGPTSFGEGDDGITGLYYISENFGLSGGIWGPSANQIKITTNKRNIIEEIRIQNIGK